MSDPVELILEFLRRHRFAKAEEAFKAELLSREDGGRHFSPSENVTDWDLQMHYCCNLQSGDNAASAADAQEVVLALEKGNYVRSSSKEENSMGMLKEEAMSPPEKQLYVEYEPGKLGFRDASSTASQEVAFEKARNLSECEASELLTTGDRVFFPIQDFNNVMQGASWISSSAKGEGLLPGAPSGDSTEPLHVGNSSRHADGEPAEHISMRSNEGMHHQLQLKPTLSLSKSQVHPQQQQWPRNVLQKELDYQPWLPHNMLACTKRHADSKGSHKRRPHLNEDKGGAGNQPVEVKASTDKVENGGEWCLQVHNTLSTSPSTEEPHKDPVLKTLLPIIFPKPSQNAEQQRLFMPEMASSNSCTVVNNRVQDGEDMEVFIAQSARIRSPLVWPQVNAETNLSSAYESGELPRLPPVRLHSIDKNMDIFKKNGSCADNEHPTSSFESQALENTEGIKGEDTLGWGTIVDVPLGHDLVTAGWRQPLLRPSVSQGIAEVLSEQLSGFANVADGLSDRWYPVGYCDSDTYEDDDDPGYLRQPIEDEEWFLAHEIDYPSDDERAKQHKDKNILNNTKQSQKADEDDRSFGEGESYFSGEEYYGLQTAKEEVYKSQQSKLRNLAEGHFVSTSLCAPQMDTGPLTFSGGGVDNNKGQIFDAEELIGMQSQPVWKVFEGQANEFDQDDVVFDGYRVDATRADGIDEDNHDSVRSGGILVSSDVADLGSEVRDSLLGCSTEGDTESFRDQELATYEPANSKSDSQEFQINKKQEHTEESSASVQHLKEDDTDHDMILQYYNEAWGLCKRSDDREPAKSTYELPKDLPRKYLTNCNNRPGDNSGSMFEGFSFPSPSSTGDAAVSATGSGKSLWSNRESLANGDEMDGYGSGMVGPDDALAAWKCKSNNSLPVICSSEENLQKRDTPNHSIGYCHSTDDCGNLEAKDHGIEESDVALPVPKLSKPVTQEEEDALAGQEDMRTLGADEDQYEIFNLRIIHRKNRTGFEEDKEFPVMINSVIAGRYHVTEYLGSAAFSKAIQAHDLHTGMDVCMKIIKNNKDFFDQSLDEIKLLKYVNKHDPLDRYHILRLYDYFYHREHLFIVCELLRANLYEFHKFNRESGGEVYFTMPRLQSITRQCLEALEFLHRLGIIHCDLKPENILVKSYSRCEIKLIDLGSSCFQTDHLCSYVQSRSYRAPEVILGLPYDQKIDIWSLGCILAELCTGNVLFQNDSLATLLARVEGILGPIDPEVLAKGRDTHKYFTKNHMLYERNQETDQLEYLLPKRTSLTHRLPMGDPGFVEFVSHLLQSNPAKRPLASEALQHPWLAYSYEPISS